ncbi:hypothetical protein D3C78_1089440 [compost metagenome]
MGKGDLLIAVQPDQAIGFIATRVNLLDAHQRRDIRHAPGMHMEHRRDGHVHVIRAQQRQALVHAQGAHGVQGMQHQLAVAEIHPLGVARGAGGVEQGRHRVLVEVGEVEVRLTPGQQRFILAQHRQPGGGCADVAELDKALDGRQLAMNLLHQRQEIIMHQHHVILGVVHGVEHLLGREADVDRVQHRANHRHGKETLKVAVAVPIEQGHGIPCLDACVDQGIGQAPDPLVERAVVVAQLVCVDDLLLRCVAGPREQQAFDQQGIAVSAFCGRDYFCFRHGGAS